MQTVTVVGLKYERTSGQAKRIAFTTQSRTSNRPPFSDLHPPPPPPERLLPPSAFRLPPHLSPLLAHILECAAETGVDGDGVTGTGSTVSVEGGGSLSRVVSSSCHDVTILALLYAMEAHLLVSLLQPHCCFVVGGNSCNYRC